MLNKKEKNVKPKSTLIGIPKSDLIVTGILVVWIAYLCVCMRELYTAHILREGVTQEGKVCRECKTCQTCVRCTRSPAGQPKKGAHWEANKLQCLDDKGEAYFIGELVYTTITGKTPNTYTFLDLSDNKIKTFMGVCDVSYKGIKIDQRAIPQEVQRTYK